MDTQSWDRGDTRGLLLSSFLGLLLAVAPHLATLARYGTLEFLTDSNDIAYLTVGGVPYRGDWSLRDPYTRPEWGTAPALGGAGREDPFQRPGARLPSLYAWAQFVPLAKLTRLLGLPQILMALVWRALGGPLLGASLFILFRALFRETSSPSAWAAGATVICLADAGFFNDGLFFLGARYLRNAWLGKYWILDYCRLLQYRVVTPLLNLPFLILLAAVLASRPSRPFLVVAAGSLALGACVLTYFFTWTTAAAGLALYAAVLAASGAAWRKRAWIAAGILAGGLLVGSPQLLSSARSAKTFSAPALKPILQRFRKGFPVAPGNPLRTAYLVNPWLWAKLAVGAAGAWRFRSAGLAFLSCAVLASYALANSAVVTGLEFENEHWLTAVGLGLAEIAVLASAVLFLDGRRFSKALLWGLPLFVLATGLAWRFYQALAAPWAAEQSRALAELRPLKASLSSLGPDCTLAGPQETAVAVLMSRCTPLFQRYDQWTSLISLDQLVERQALNAWIRGYDLARFLKAADADPLYFYREQMKGQSVPPEMDPAVIAGKRERVFRGLQSGTAPEILAKYRPNVLLLPAAEKPGARGGPWELIERAPRWSLWRTAR